MELWHLVNPRLDETIHKTTVEKFLKDFLYIAIDMNISKSFQLFIFTIFIDLLKLGDEHNDKEENQKSLKYLEEAQ